MKIPFVKMHGLSNDFVIIDARGNISVPDLSQLSALTRRKTGIGCDQLGLIYAPTDERADIFIRFLNAPDATEIEACGNMSRCVAWLIMEEMGRNELVIQTIADHLICTRQNSRDTRITVDFGVPKLNWQDIPLAEARDTLHLDIGDKGVQDPVGVNVGNPHAVFFVEDCETLDLQTIGPRFENHPLFPRKANIEFATILDRHNIRMRVWERDTGETVACGSGACATHVAAVRRGYTAPESTIMLDGGELDFTWREENGRCYMTGDTAFVFEGQIVF